MINMCIYVLSSVIAVSLWHYNHIVYSMTIHDRDSTILTCHCSCVFPPPTISSDYTSDALTVSFFHETPAHTSTVGLHVTIHGDVCSLMVYSDALNSIKVKSFKAICLSFSWIFWEEATCLSNWDIHFKFVLIIIWNHKNLMSTW